MNLSLSALIISSIASSVLVGILHLVLKNSTVYKAIRSDFLLIICLTIFLRLSFPFELMNTITIPSKIVLPAIFKLFEQRITFRAQSFELAKLFVFIWGVGAFIQLGRLLLKLLKLKNIAKIISKEQSSLKSHSNFIEERKIRIFITNCVDTPTVLGVIKPCILLPNTNFSSTEFEYILLHEEQHIKNKDVLKKYLVEVLIAIYWWMVPLYIFRNQVSLVLEFNVDQQVTNKLSDEEYFEYAQCLVSVQKKVSSNHNLKQDIVANFTVAEKFILKRRVNFLIEGYEHRRTKRIFLFIALMVPLLVTSFIFEPFRANESNMTGTEKIDDEADSYLIREKNGDLILYIDGGKVGIVSDPNDPSLKGLKIINQGGE